MSDGLVCDRCGKNLLIDEKVRYYIGEKDLSPNIESCSLMGEDGILLANDRGAEFCRQLRQLSHAQQRHEADLVSHRLGKLPSLFGGLKAVDDCQQCGLLSDVVREAL